MAERQPNTELREKALAKRIASLAPVAWQIDAALFEQQVEELVAAFAASIQAEAQQQIEQITADRDTERQLKEVNFQIMQNLGLTNHINGWTNERAEAAEKQLAEGKKDALLWQEIAADYGLKRDAAEAEVIILNEQLADIHNRFCGENGELCQVCRLKAEREEGR